jgi:hypothetical protein
VSTMKDEIDEKTNSGRKTIAVASDDPDEMEPRRVPPAMVAAGVGAALVGLGLIGWLIYRSRRRQNLVRQLQATLPGRISELRDLGVERLGDLRELGVERVGDVRSLRDEVRRRLRKAL